MRCEHLNVNISMNTEMKGIFFLYGSIGLDNPSTADPLLHQIVTLFHALEDTGSSYTFVWRHVVIEGNEEANACLLYTSRCV